MRTLKIILLALSLGTIVTSCYVDTRPSPYYYHHGYYYYR